MSRTFRVVVVRDQASADDRAESGIARALRQAGFEVIVAAPSAVPEQAAEAALQEDADAVVVAGSADEASVGSSAADLVEAALGDLGLDDVVVVVGTSPGELLAVLEQALDRGPPAAGGDAES